MPTAITTKLPTSWRSAASSRSARRCAADLDKLKGAPLIVCCETGIRSTKAVSALKKQGFERVFSLDGGIAAWNKAGLPLTSKKDGHK